MMMDDFKEHDKDKWITAILSQTKEGDEAVLGDPQVGDLRPMDRRVHHGWSWQRSNFQSSTHLGVEQGTIGMSTAL